MSTIRVAQAGPDFYQVHDPIRAGAPDRHTFLETFPIRRPLPPAKHTAYGAQTIEDGRARHWFEGWCAERGLVPEFVS